MDLEKLLESLKKNVLLLDEFLSESEFKSGADFAEKYVRENQLEYISEEIKNAVKAGFLFAYHKYQKRVKNVGETTL